ncbi:MAG: signal peptidase II [Streptococcaceae bacterium]|jgi:signal peptidase II|nr:signal peptidase II [Streptococcaceae bacterium]
MKFKILNWKLKVISLIFLLIKGLCVDQIVKYFVVQKIPVGKAYPIIKGVFSVTHLQNDGAAWSILAGQQWFFILTTVIVLGFAVWFLIQNFSKHWYAFGLTLIISGALGNFIDRLHQGYVVDMFQLDFINFPIFNVADVLLTVGFAALMIGILIEKDEA